MVSTPFDLSALGLTLILAWGIWLLTTIMQKLEAIRVLLVALARNRGPLDD